MPDPIGAAQVVAKDKATKVLYAPTEQTHRTVRNAGANAVQLSRDSGLTATNGFKLAAAGEQRVVLNPGETLYAICATGLESVLEVI